MPLMPMWQRFSSRFPEITWRAPCWATRTDNRWSSLEIIPLQYNFIKWKQLLLAKTILLNVQLSKAQKSNLYICWVWFFLDKFHPPHPYTIVIKVHLSAISLPRKQLSVKNSACFFSFVLFFRVFFVSGLVFVPRSYSMWVDFFILLKGNRGADPRVLVKCFVRCGSLLGRPVTCTPLKPRSSEMRTMRMIPEGLPASA